MCWIFFFFHFMIVGEDDLIVFFPYSYEERKDKEWGRRQYVEKIWEEKRERGEE